MLFFPAQAEYYYFCARDFGLKTFLYFSYIIAYDISVLEFQPRYSYKIYYKLVVIKDYECVRRRIVNFNTDTLNDFPI